MFAKPFRAEETASNCIEIFDARGIKICQIVNDEDVLTARDRKTGATIVDALNAANTE